MKKSGLAFHCHHDTLYEFVWDYDKRVQFIKKYKPKDEIELRLRLFKMIPKYLIPGKESIEHKAYCKAWGAYNKARDAYNKAWEAYYGANNKSQEAYNQASENCDRAWVACNKAQNTYDKKYGKKIIKLHNKLCQNCPWNGTTIFT